MIEVPLNFSGHNLEMWVVECFCCCCSLSDSMFLSLNNLMIFWVKNESLKTKKKSSNHIGASRSNAVLQQHSLNWEDEIKHVMTHEKVVKKNIHECKYSRTSCWHIFTFPHMRAGMTKQLFRVYHWHVRSILYLKIKKHNSLPPYVRKQPIFENVNT